MRTTTICKDCGSSVSLSNIGKHTGSKKCKNGGKQMLKPYTSCHFCNQNFSSSSGRGVHEIQCLKNPARRILNLGRTAWNKGNRSKPDTRDPEFIGKVGGYRPNAGRSKKFRVYDTQGNIVVLQSTYELDLFEILCELGVRWERPKALKYDNKNYFADFYLLDFDVWLDPKNSYKAKQDLDKITKVIEQNNIRLYVLLKHQLDKEFIAGII